MSYRIFPIRALADNYIWAIVHLQTRSAVIIDPGEAIPVEQWLNAQDFTLSAILITHHHWDHTHGIAPLSEKYSVPVYASAKDTVMVGNVPINAGDTIELPDLDLRFAVLDIPGHTRGHVAYYGQGWVFTGDTLFAGGCGRPFEGTPQQLYQSLMQLQQLDPNTLVYCGHEYTQKNLDFAKQVDPDNPLLQQRIEETVQKRMQGEPTLPSTIGLERRTNPFLRCTEPCIRKNVEKHVGHSLPEDPAAVFTELRRWKDTY